MLKIWGRTSSINVRKVLWTAQELGLPFEHIEAGGPFGRVRTPEFMALNPNATVPLLEDDGTGNKTTTDHTPVTLWESNVIVRYLFASHAREGDLAYPTDLRSRFMAEQWMDWQQTTLNPAGRDGFVQLIRTPEIQRDAAAIARSVAAVGPLLQLLDAHLSRQPFIGGDVFGMADIPVGCEMHRWFGLPLARETLPHLDAWYAGLLARPASRGVLDLELS